MVQMVIESIFPYTCNHCGEAFEDKKDLFDHLREDECGWKGIEPINTPADDIHEQEKEDLALDWGKA